ncbi:nuclear transport factor 2 family protein [Olivibacter sp. XZL3]|uniref:nuclear transport factor 2 family protein n=1 Tax=Olivibacter sp. XZL3 TaxID=1735116 RepID=UPI0010658D2F|nr:nuclear transport factor 2 family protein [Olivibacter sp. XZL3]
MNLPKAVADLVKAQDNLDSTAYANCFREAAHVVDEGKTYAGRTAIKNWIEKANKEYKIVMKPIDFTTAAQNHILSAEISGKFPGSPITLKYHLELEEGLIKSLKITS